MKKLATVLVFGILSGAAIVFGSEKTGKDEVRQCNVLVVGFPENNMFTYYTDSEVASACSVNKDSIYNGFYKSLCKNMVFNARGVNMIPVFQPELAQPLLSLVKYTDTKLQWGEYLKIIDLDKLPGNELKDFANSYDADYILFINYYEFNYKGDPYFSIEHKIHYQLISRNKKVMEEDILSFLTGELVQLDKFEKKVKKKFTKQFAKQADVIVPLERPYQAMNN